MWEANKQMWNGFKQQKTFVIIGKEEERRGWFWCIITYRYFMARNTEAGSTEGCFIPGPYPDFLNILPYPDPMKTTLHTLVSWYFMGPDNCVRSEYLIQYLPVRWLVSKLYSLSWRDESDQSDSDSIFSCSFPPSYLDRGTKTDNSRWWLEGLKLYTVRPAGHREPCARCIRRRSWLRTEDG